MQEEQRAREALERKLRFRLSDDEWELLVEDGYHEEILGDLSGEFEREGGLEMAAGRVKRMRRAYGDAFLETNRLRLVTAKEKGAPPVHDRALSLAISHIASRDPEVVEFREEVLGARLLHMEEIKGWIEERAREEGEATSYLKVPLPPKTKLDKTKTSVVLEPPLALDDLPHGAFGLSVEILRYGVEESDWAQGIPVAIGGVLDRLRGLSERLESLYSWGRAEATVFVLTGAAPLLADMRGGIEIKPMFPAASRITLEVDISVGPKRLAVAYAKLRKKYVPGRYRPLSPKHLRLAVFALEEREKNRPWAEIMQSWNESYGREFAKGTYEQASNFRRDALKAQERLLKSGPTPVAL